MQQTLIRTTSKKRLDYQCQHNSRYQAIELRGTPCEPSDREVSVFVEVLANLVIEQLEEGVRNQ
jgi:hypothetical protein